jgi:hypothetical protein
MDQHSMIVNIPYPVVCDTCGIERCLCATIPWVHTTDFRRICPACVEKEFGKTIQELIQEEDSQWMDAVDRLCSEQ